VRTQNRSIQTVAFGADQPQVAATIATALQTAGDIPSLTEAVRLYDSAIIVDMRVFGGQHPRVANSLMNKTNVLQELNELHEALPLYDRVMRFGPPLTESRTRTWHWRS
jgi:hypothetical protein